MTRCKYSTIALLVLASAFLGGANTFVEDDEVEMTTIQDHAMKLKAEISRAILGRHPTAAEVECMTEMSNDLQLISLAAEHLRLLVSVATRMKDEADEALILKVIKVSGHQAIGSYVLAGGDLDHASLACATSSLVTTEAQEMRNYLASATTATSAMLAKIN